MKKPQSQIILNLNIDCVGCYGHAERSTSLSYLENVNNLNKAKVICRNLGKDKDLWYLIVYVTDELADVANSRRKKKLTGWNSNNLEIKGNIWLEATDGRKQIQLVCGTEIELIFRDFILVMQRW